MNGIHLLIEEKVKGDCFSKVIHQYFLTAINTLTFSLFRTLFFRSLNVHYNCSHQDYVKTGLQFQNSSLFYLTQNLAKEKI